MRTGAETSDIARRAAPIAVIAAATLCAWLAAKVLLTVLGAGASGSNERASVFSALALTPPRESLARWHLFGHALAPVDARAAAANAPETALDLTLVGVLAEADPAAGIAMIAEGSGAQTFYYAGAALPGGARLKGVYADHVLIIHNGRDEILRLPREAESAQTPAGSASSSNASARASAPDAAVSVAGLETVDWQAVQRQIQVDPAELGRQVRMLPVIENGQMIGVRLGGGAQAPLLAKLGLRPDDVVTAVNGISVRDTGRAQQVIAAVRDAQQVSVTVRRDGREETLNVSLK